MAKPKARAAQRMDLVQAIVAAFLKPLGFRKQGRTFNRTVDVGIVQIVNFQTGQYPIGPHYEVPGLRTSLYGKFCVNLGVYVSEVFERFLDKLATPRFPKEYDCEIRVRLNAFVAGVDKADSWWKLNDDVDSVAKDVIKKLEIFGLPFMDRFRSREAIVRSWIPFSGEHKLLGSNRSRLAVAIILLKRGEREAAQALFNEHLSRPSANSQHHVYVRELAQRLGLDVS